jgi:hypothetical protein
MATPHTAAGSGDTESDFGFYFGAALKYPITPEMNFYLAPDMLYILTEDEDVADSSNTMIIEIPVGIEYWFM